MILLAGYNYPSYFKEDQQINAAIIIEQANRFDLDPHRFIAIAWVESRLKSKRVSHTGAVVLKEMRRYKACAGLNLAACYNGGPGWQKSKNKKKISEYATRVNCLARSYKNKFPNWKQ